MKQPQPYRLPDKHLADMLEKVDNKLLKADNQEELLIYKQKLLNEYDRRQKL